MVLLLPLSSLLVCSLYNLSLLLLRKAIHFLVVSIYSTWKVHWRYPRWKSLFRDVFLACCFENLPHRKLLRWKWAVKFFENFTQQTIISSKTTIEALEQCVKYI